MKYQGCILAVSDMTACEVFSLQQRYAKLAGGWQRNILVYYPGRLTIFPHEVVKQYVSACISKNQPKKEDAYELGTMDRLLQNK